MDGIPTTRWKSIQWMEIPPRVGWISNYLSQNRWLEFQPFLSQWQARFYYQFSTFPFWSFQNYESESGLQFTRIWRFSSVEMGNSLEQYRASIGLYHSGAGAGQKRIEPDVFWVALKDLLLTILLLQCLTFGFFEMQLQRLHQPGCGSGEEASFVFCLLATKVAIKYLCICLFVPEWVRFRVGFIKVCYDGKCSRRPFLHFSAFPTFQL